MSLRQPHQPITCINADTTATARAALNFKGIPYKTEWVEYPDMAAKFESFGIPPTAENSPSGWSIPAVRMPDGSYIMDSRKIADALESMKPEPSLRLDSGYVDRVQTAVLDTMKPLAPVIMPRIPEMVLNPSSAEYFRTTRAKRFGMPLEEFAKSEQSGEVAWKGAEPGLREIAKILREHADGPFVLGKEPSYADLVLAGLLVMAARVDQNDVFQRITGFDGVFAKHYEACQKFVDRDDH